MRLRTSAAVASAIACLLAMGAVALAATSNAGPIRLFLTYENPTTDKILVTGAIADYGTAVSQDANGKVDPNGNFEKVTLKHGGFIINATALTKAIEAQFSREPVNPSNCSLAFSGTGPSTIGTGTGAYAGIGGKLKISLIIAGIAPKTATGRCNLNSQAAFLGQYQGATATGSVSFT